MDGRCLLLVSHAKQPDVHMPRWCLRCPVQLTPEAWCRVPAEGFSPVLSSVWSHIQSQEANCPLKATTRIGDIMVPFGGRYNVATVGGEPGGEVGSYLQQVQAQACPEQAGPSCRFGDAAWLRLTSRCSAASQGTRRLSCSNHTYTHIYHTWLSQPGRTDALPEQRGRPAERLIFNKTHSGTQREVASGKGREQGAFVVSQPGPRGTHRRALGNTEGSIRREQYWPFSNSHTAAWEPFLLNSQKERNYQPK